MHTNKATRRISCTSKYYTNKIYATSLVQKCVSITSSGVNSLIFEISLFFSATNFPSSIVISLAVFVQMQFYYSNQTPTIAHQRNSITRWLLVLPFSDTSTKKREKEFFLSSLTPLTSSFLEINSRQIFFLKTSSLGIRLSTVFNLFIFFTLKSKYIFTITTNIYALHTNRRSLQTNRTTNMMKNLLCNILTHWMISTERTLIHLLWFFWHFVCVWCVG